MEGVAKPPRDPCRSVPASRWRCPDSLLPWPSSEVEQLSRLGCAWMFWDRCSLFARQQSRSRHVPFCHQRGLRPRRLATGGNLSKGAAGVRARHGQRELQGCGGVSSDSHTQCQPCLCHGAVIPTPSAVGLSHSDCTSQAGLHQASQPVRGARSAPGGFHTPASAWLLSRWSSQCTLLP